MRPPELPPDSDLSLAIAAALKGAALGLDYFGRVASLDQEAKADGSLVTEADLAVETEVKAVLQTHRPADAFLGEETGEQGTGSRRWILDGIDGTLVFVLGDDRWQSLIALEVDGRVEVGVAVVPAQREIWFAQRGGGAYVQGFDSSGLLGVPRSLTAGHRTKLGEATVGVLPPVDMVPPEVLSEVAEILQAAMQKDWSCHAALLVSDGRLDMAVQVGGKVWDYAPLGLIVEEAGGAFCGAGGEGHPVIGVGLFAASNALLVEATEALVR